MCPGFRRHMDRGGEEFGECSLSPPQRPLLILVLTEIPNDLSSVWSAVEVLVLSKKHFEAENDFH